MGTVKRRTGTDMRLRELAKCENCDQLARVYREDKNTDLCHGKCICGARLVAVEALPHPVRGEYVPPKVREQVERIQAARRVEEARAAREARSAQAAQYRRDLDAAKYAAEAAEQARRAAAEKRLSEGPESES